MLLAMAIALGACVSPGSGDTNPPTTAAPPASTTTEIAPPPLEIPEEETGYLDEAIEFIRNNSYYTPAVEDWEELRAVAVAEQERHIERFGVDGPISPRRGTYNGIEALLREMGDTTHGSVRNPDQVERTGSPEEPGDSSDRGVAPEGELINGSIGYLWLPSANTYSQEVIEYASDVHAMINSFAGEDACGWIIDLSDNRSGSGAVPLLSIGPFLAADEEPVIWFRKADGDEYGFWRYHPDTASITLDGESVPDPDEYSDAAFSFWNAAYTIDDPAAPVSETVPVAVVVSGDTGSGGEMPVVALTGRDNLRVFGSNTNGLTTGSLLKDMPDGAQIQVTYALMVDRTGVAYDGPIVPEEKVSQSSAVDKAGEWLQSEGCPI
jgi:hypothetical protein